MFCLISLGTDAPVWKGALEHQPDRKVVEGEQLSLPCHAEAHPEPTKDWTKDGSKLFPTPGKLMIIYSVMQPCSVLT